MFYVKSHDEATGLTVQMDILDGSDGNLFTRCPVCGQEFHVECLREITDCDHFDLYSSSVLCTSCSAKRIARRSHTKGAF